MRSVQSFETVEGGEIGERDPNAGAKLGLGSMIGAKKAKADEPE